MALNGSERGVFWTLIVWLRVLVIRGGERSSEGCFKGVGMLAGVILPASRGF